VTRPRTPPPPFVATEGGEAETLPIGAICAWPHGVTYPTGWVLCDGTANATGSGLDLRGRFLVGWDGSHTANGGGLTHTHAGHAAHAFTQPAAHTTVAAHIHQIRRERSATTGGATTQIARTADTSSTIDETVNTESTGSASVAHSGGAVDAHSAHDGPNSEPPYSPIDWIERLT